MYIVYIQEPIVQFQNYCQAKDGLGLPDDDLAYGSALWPDGHEHAHSGLDGTLTL